MKKLFILILMTFVLSSFVFASDYDVNDSIRIDALYTEGGVLSEANANITIEDPTGDIRVSNEAMNESSTGTFYYDYLIPDETGEYFVTVRFYDKVNNTLQGIDTDTFIVGEDRLTFGKCPANRDLSFLWFVIGLCFVMFLIEIIFRVRLIGIIGSLGIIFTSLYFYACAFFIGTLVLSLGLCLLGFTLFKDL